MTTPTETTSRDGYTLRHRTDNAVDLLGPDGARMATIVGAGDRPVRFADEPARGTVIAPAPPVPAAKVAAVQAEVLALAERFKNDLGFVAPELYDARWADFFADLRAAFDYAEPADIGFDPAVDIEETPPGPVADQIERAISDPSTRIRAGRPERHT